MSYLGSAIEDPIFTAEFATLEISSCLWQNAAIGDAQRWGVGMTDVTRILSAIERGDSKATDELLPLVYEELRILAAQKLAHEKPGQTLQATALVHEAYLRLVGSEPQTWENHGHFFAAAAEAMRRILVERARSRKAMRHGGGIQRVAYLEGTSLKVKDVASQALVAERPVPLATRGGSGWSANGRELYLSGHNNIDNRTGLWICSLGRTEPVRVLSGPITDGACVPDGKKLAFCLGPPYFEIWVASLDPNLSTLEALGPSHTLEEHSREMIRFYTRRIEADPLDAYAYSSRAQYHDRIGDKTNAHADMRLWSAVQCPELPRSSILVGSPTSQRVIDLPFHCQVVLSAERPVNEIPTISVAFGQQGRWEMKLCEVPMFLVVLLGVGLQSSLDTPAAYADFTFAQPVQIPWAEQGNILCFSYDGLEVYMGAARPEGHGGSDLYVRRRASVDDEWGTPENLGPLINTPSHESMASISGDGLTLYFNSDRSGGFGWWDIYVTTRATKDDPWGKAVNAGPPMNTPYVDGEPWITQDGRELYFISYRPGGYGQADIYVTRRATENDPWGEAVNLGPTVNTPYEEQMFSLSPNGLLLLFQDYYDPSDTPRPGGYGGGDLWMTRRTAVSEPWLPVVNLGPMVNGPLADGWPRILPDGRTLCFWNSSAGSNYRSIVELSFLQKDL